MCLKWLVRWECIYMYLNNKARLGLERIIGKPTAEIANMTLDDEIRYVEKKTGKPLLYSKNVDNRIYRRGNPLLVRGRIYNMQEVDKRILKLK